MKVNLIKLNEFLHSNHEERVKEIIYDSVRQFLGLTNYPSPELNGIKVINPYLIAILQEEGILETEEPS